MNTTDPKLRTALSAANASGRLRAVLAAGTRPNPQYVHMLIDALRTEPDFYVRDMLTWALTRHPADSTVPLLITIVESPASSNPARAQALHTLSKIADPRAWSVITDALLADPDDTVARTAWRTAVILAPQAAQPELARRLIAQLGRGDREVQLSLSRVLADLAEHAEPLLSPLARSADASIGAHARATLRLITDPDAAFELDVDYAKRVDALGGKSPNGR